MFSHALNRLLGRYLKPYALNLALVVLLQFIATMAGLELPALNADIIDSGVAKGDTAFIWSHGALMLGVSLIQVVAQILAVWLGARTAMGFG